MASDVDICNLALSRLGDNAVLTAISPPDGSPQSSRCAAFYPIALTTLQEMHEWAFNTVRNTLAPTPAPLNGYQFAYAWPNLALNVFSILPPDAQDDYAQLLPPGPPTDILAGQSGYSYINRSLYMPQPYTVEIDPATGNKIILTNQPNATARYTIKVTDTSKFSFLFVDTLAWLLASYLAGPIYKGEDGAKMAQVMFKAFMAMYQTATAKDANNSYSKVQQATSWITNR